MATRVRKTNKKLRTILLFLLLIGGSLYFYQQIKRQSFPALEVASYQGSISGFLANPEKKSSLLIERLSDLPVLLVFIFIDGLEPQLINFGIQPDGSFQKLELKINNQSYFLSGLEKSGVLQGKVYLGASEQGVWSLEKKNNSIFDVLENSTGENQVSRLILNKARHQSLKQEFDAVSERYRERSKKFVELQGLLNNRDALAIYAKEKREALDKELKQALDEQEALDKEVEDEYQNLRYLRRISKSGRALSLTKKIAEREATWFLASLPVEKRVDLAGSQFVEEEEEEQENLTEAEKRLLMEYQSLQETVEREKKAIGILERQLLERRAVSNDSARKTKGKIKKNRWWKFWD